MNHILTPLPVPSSPCPTALRLCPSPYIHSSTTSHTFTQTYTAGRSDVVHSRYKCLSIHDYIANIYSSTDSPPPWLSAGDSVLLIITSVHHRSPLSSLLHHLYLWNTYQDRLGHILGCSNPPSDGDTLCDRSRVTPGSPEVRPRPRNPPGSP